LVALALGLALTLSSMGFFRTSVSAFMLAVIGSAISFGVGPSLLACITSALAYDYFFLPPIHALTISAREDVVALAFYLIVALITSNLTARVRAQAIAASQRAEITQGMFLLSRRLASSTTRHKVLTAAADEISRVLRADVHIFVPGMDLILASPGGAADAHATLSGAQRHWTMTTENRVEEPRAVDPGVIYRFIQAGRDRIGLIGVRQNGRSASLKAEQISLVGLLTDQVNVAIERVQLAEKAELSRRIAEADRLRTALLASLSHDLRTPLAAVLACTGILVAGAATLDEDSRHSILLEIGGHAHQLNRFITNLLDMTRLEAGPLRPRLIPVEVADVIGAAIARAREIAGTHALKARIEPGLPLLELDPILLEHALFNILDNAAKYTEAGLAIGVTARREGGTVVIDVTDEGNGIPAAELERIFDKFHRLPGAGPRHPGTGLGLAICRGFIDAMGGAITARNRHDRPGAIFTVSFPVPDFAELEEALSA
jgi:two-component system sensor histidine kinase KdpD